MSTLAIQFHRGGVYLPALGLWLDPHQPQNGQDRVFISHAHSDHTGVHREVILSEPTASLMRSRLAGEWLEHALPFGQPAEFSAGDKTSFQITLLPAGHIFGSAMSLIHAEGKSLLYTGDFKLRPGLSAEACDPAPARGVDVLIMETTYGRPSYQFPPTAEVMQGVIRFCREAIDNEETPVLLGYSLGKSQELLCALGQAGLPMMLHAAAHKMTEIYAQFGQSIPLYEKLNPDSARGKVLICPPSVASSQALRKIGRLRTAMLTGWAMDTSSRYRYQVDAAFPISDHADFTGLVEFVRCVEPKKVYTLHGFASDFAQTLRDLGYDAQALSEEEQLALPMGLGVPGIGDPGAGDGRQKAGTKEQDRRNSMPDQMQPIKASAPLTAPPNEAMAFDATTPGTQQSAPALDHSRFAEFAETCARIGATSKKLEKVARLAEHLRNLDVTQLACVTPWYTGHPFPPTENKHLQLGWAVIRDALCGVGDLDHGAFGQVYLKHSDLGETAFEILNNLGNTGNRVSVSAVHQLFDRLHNTRGPLAKVPVLAATLGSCAPLEGKYLVKILTGELRIGLKEGLVEEGIAEAFGAPLPEVRNTNLLLGNIGETAALAAENRLASATLVPFRPVKFALASPEETASDIWNRVAEWRTASASEGAPTDPSLFLQSDLKAAIQSAPIAWVEDKYDGIRCQLHKVGSRVGLYSRDLKEITSMFLDLVDLIQSAPVDVVIDGEIIAMRGEEILPFAELQRRLGRREGDLFLQNEIPIQFFAFDLLWRDGQNLLNESLNVRRAALETALPPGVRLTQLTRVRSSDEIETAFQAARSRGNEGLMIKDPASTYTPGRRGLAWLKLKKAYASLDCVVVGAEYGHGKRKKVLSDYTFAVRDAVSGELKTIGKAFTGLTDLEIAQLTHHFLGRVLEQQGRYHAVAPDTVLEIAFDRLQPSERHSSGLAMRFPRIVRIRTDKTVAEIDTLETARKLVQA